MVANIKPLAWPPPYTVRISARAKRISLYLSKNHGLEIVLPKKHKLDVVPKILEEKRRWIERHLPKIQSANKTQHIPFEINLPAIAETWSIHYLPSDEENKIRIIPRPNQELYLIGAIHNTRLCQKALICWLKSKGKTHLPLLLRQVSDKIKLPYNRLTIRGQKTVWGSCTADNNINLNYKLLLLEPALARYVLIHELCHTKHHNHSKRFWALVERFEENYLALRKTLRGVGTRLPAWLQE